MPRSHPKLKIFCWTLAASADELWLQGSFLSFFRTILVFLNILFVLLVAGFIGLTECEDPDVDDQYGYAVAFALASLVCTSLSVILYYIIRRISKRGDIFDYKSRSHIVVPIYGLLVFYILELVVIGGGILLAVNWEESESPDDACLSENEARRSWIIFWVVWILLDVVWFVGFAKISVLRKRDAKKLKHMDEFEVLSWEWNQRFRTWCATTKMITLGLIGGLKGSQKDHAFDQVGDVFGRWFTGHDMTLSDLIAALLLLRLEQKRRKNSSLYRSFDPITEAFDMGVKERRISEDLNLFLWGEEAPVVRPESAGTQVIKNQAIQEKRKTKGIAVPKFEMKTSAQSWEKTEENIEMMRYIQQYTPHMLSVYGWKLLVYMDTIELRPFRSMAKLLRLPMSSGLQSVQSDNCCRCETSTLLAHTDLSSGDILYASFANVEGEAVPYAVLADHNLKSVVFTCRGSLSLQDIITDILIEPHSLAASGRKWGFDGEKHYAHKGFFLVAELIRKRLQQNQLLHRLLGVYPKIEADPLEETDPSTKAVAEGDLPDCSGYDLVIVGHSLGGGVASILSLMLRSEFPNLKCLAYSVPGCVFDTALAEKSKDWIISPFVGKDMVAHLSWESLLRMRARTLDMLRRSRASKGEIYESVYRKKKLSNLLYDAHEIPDTPARNEITNQIQELSMSAKAKFERIPMHNPGRLVHFAKVKTTKQSRFKRVRTYSPSWIDQDDMHELEISTRMLLDHFPNYVAFIINQTAHEFIPEF